MDEFRRKLIQLEALYGSQKKAAKKLGVSERTYRSYKSGATEPPKARQTKANRLIGANKQKLEPLAPKIEKKIERYEASFKKPKIEAANTWLNAKFGKDQKQRFITATLNNLEPYVAYPKNDSSSVQFYDGTGPTGKPKGTKFITVIGIVSLNYDVNAPEKGNVIRTPLDTLGSFTQDWDLEQTLDYAENHFMGRTIQVGRRKFLPVQFIGYTIGGRNAEPIEKQLGIVDKKSKWKRRPKRK